MGRVLSINNVDAQTFNVLAAESINENDLVQMGPDGKGYHVQATVEASVANCAYGATQTNAATGTIVAQTQLEAAATTSYYRQAIMRSSDGSVYAVAYNTTYGAMLYKYSRYGVFLAKKSLDASAVTTNQICELSNGYIVTVCGRNTGVTTLSVFDQSLNTISAPFELPETAANAYCSVVTLAGGGFAVVYQMGGSPLLSKLVVYNNTGTVVLSPTTIWTRTGTSGTQYHRVAQLSNGNLVVAVSSTNTGASIGLFHGVVTTAGVVVSAFSNIDTTSSAWLPELSVMEGYYAISRANGTNQIAAVFNNGGAKQGNNFTSATTAGKSNTSTKLLNGGSDFYLIWQRSPDSKVVLSKVPVTGTGYTSSDITASDISQYDGFIDAFCDKKMIVGVTQGAESLMALWVADTITMSLVSKSVAKFGVSPVNSQDARIIPGSDFSFICLYTHNGTPSSTNMYVGKYASSAILGVAKTSAASGQLVAVSGESGGHKINAIDGTTSVAFDHSSTPVIGNKGTLMRYGVTLKGV